MSPAREKSLRVIGEDSLLYMKKANWSGNRLVGDSARPCKPFGEVHLKDSLIRTSKADDKRLSIFTWTKILHLRCMSREDRAVWIEALVAAKDVFRRVLTSSDFRPSEDIAVVTEKLRLRLQQEGIGEAVIKDCESIMLSETSELQNQMKAMKALQHKHALLLDTLRQLETEKIELETNVVDETKEQESYCGQDKSLFAVAGGATDSILKLSELDKADNKNNSNAGDFIKTPETVLPSAASTSSTHSFGETPGGVSLKNGSSASASSNPVVFSNLTSQNSSTSSLFTNDGSDTASIMTATTPTPASSNSCLSTSTPAPSGLAASVSKFGSSTPSTAAAPVSETSSSSAASLLKLSTDSTAVAPISETSSAPAEPVKFVSSTTLTAAAPVSETSTAPVAPEFEFGSTVASSSFAPVPHSSDVVSEAIKMKQDTSFGMPRTADDDKYTAKVSGIDSRNQKVNHEDSTPPKKDAVSGPETFVPAAQNSVAYHPQKKWAFRMSVPEEFLNSDDDSYPNGDASDALLKGAKSRLLFGRGEELCY
ncbi:mucin-5AC [Morus notabilis]|uniref:mucin-5AC n=1 Tax=Morus notabilis TaxID=981085 RepID=UPI000CED0647|nr:mucin-5AC [Morus notabilis]